LFIFNFVSKIDDKTIDIFLTKAKYERDYMKPEKAFANERIKQEKILSGYNYNSGEL